MTIAACLLTSGGVVLGADSVSTLPVQGAGEPHYFAHAQKIFEIGEDSTLGVVTWGLASIDGSSYRRLFADLGDKVQNAESVEAVAEELIRIFWEEYRASANIVAAQKRLRVLKKKGILSFDKDEMAEWESLHGYEAGFCIAGRMGSDRTPHAFEVVFDPKETKPPKASALPQGRPQFWGVSNLIRRLVYGIDFDLITAIDNSVHWKGTDKDLGELIEPFVLRLATNLPIREAIDYVHAVISLTCKGIKFSQHPPHCGGHVEIAVITADRRFRWVSHKNLRQALP